MAHQSKYPSLDRQWHKMMFSFFEYLPMQYRQATEREWQIRKMIWSFKDGKAYLNIAWMIANKLHQVFGDDVKNIVFACVPASSADKNELRYKGFASAVCKFSGAINAYEHIRVSGDRLAIHEKFDSKSLQKVQVIEFDKDFFRGKKILVFDDILTKGFSYARFACQLEKIGGEVLGGFFLASFPQQDNPPHGYRIFLSASTHLQGRWGSCTHDRDKGSCGHRCISSTSS